MHVQLRPLAEQVIVITGASSGIGLCTARMAARAGAAVVMASRNGRALREAADAIVAQGGQAIAVETDVKSRGAVAALGEAAIERFGRIDTWVNNAGASYYAPLRRGDLASHRETFEVIYWGTVHGSLEAVERLRAQGGALINVGSVLSDAPMPLQAPYVAAKHAVKGFTDCLRIELSHDRAPICVTLIKPSAIGTPFADHARADTELAPVVPPPRYGPEAVASAILHAATTPTRNLIVGGAGAGMSALHSVAPNLFDRLMDVMGYRGQFQDRPLDPEDPMRDNLFQPRRDGEERSPHLSSGGRAFSLYTEMAKHPQLTLAGAAVAAAAITALARSPRTRAYAMQIAASGAEGVARGAGTVLRTLNPAAASLNARY